MSSLRKTYVNVKFSLILFYWLSDQLNREREVTEGDLINKRCFENRYCIAVEGKINRLSRQYI